MKKSGGTTAASTKPSGEADEATRSATEYLIATRQAERTLKAGDHAPPFRLRDQNGAAVVSETLLRRGPLLLTFYPGPWYQPCSQDLQAFESHRGALEARGASLVAISQQTVAANARTHAELRLGFPILCDRGGRIAEQFGVRWCVPDFLRDIHIQNGIDLPFLNGERSWTLVIPSRFVVDKAGFIAYSEINPGQSGRSRPPDVLPVLDHLSSLRAA